MIPISYSAHSGARTEQYTMRFIPIRSLISIISKIILILCLMRMCDLLLSSVTKTSKISKIMAPTINKPSYEEDEL